MEDKNNNNVPDALEDPIVLAVIALILFSVGSMFTAQRANYPIVNSFSGVQIEDLSTLYESKTPVSSTTPIGAPVVTTRETVIYETRALTRELGRFGAGEHGILRDGPITARDTLWWFVDFERDPDGWVEQRTLVARAPLVFMRGFIRTYIHIALIVSLLFLVGIIYSVIRTNQIRVRQKEELDEVTKNAPLEAGPPATGRWERILEHIESDRESEWRLAIIEADVMLDEMMSAMGYTHDTLGEKLKAVERSDFTTIDKAWDAHKMRNKIAHEGSSFRLSQREAILTLQNYKEVFEEFNYI